MKTYEKIRSIREHQHLTQEDMAHKLKMSPQGYAKIERGETRLNLPRLEQIAEILETDILEFLADDNKKIIYQVNNEAENNTTLTYYAAPPDSAAEIEKLNLIIRHKDEQLRHKDQLLSQQNRELAALQEIIALLKKQ